jgi:hypothetical protein
MKQVTLLPQNQKLNKKQENTLQHLLSVLKVTLTWSSSKKFRKERVTQTQEEQYQSDVFANRIVKYLKEKQIACIWSRQNPSANSAN